MNGDMTLSKMTLYMLTLSIKNDTMQNKRLTIIILLYRVKHFHFNAGRSLLSVVKQSVVKQSVVKQSVIKQSVV
jgi:hypothetical protein